MKTLGDTSLELEKKDSLAEIVRAVRIFGPRNYTAVARITGLPTETVRYKIKKQLLRRGIRIHTHIDHGKLGLARYLLKLEFREETEPYAPNILDKLAETAYLEYYARTIPEGYYLCHIGLPPRLETKYKILLEKLVETGILKKFDISRMNWVRYFSIRPEFYDFEKGKWNVDWSRIDTPRNPVEVSIEEDVLDPPPVDELDLKILVWLQLDASLSIAKIARKIKEPFKKTLYHFKEHIIKNEIVKRYIIDWQTPFEKISEIVDIILIFRDIKAKQLNYIKRYVEPIPFLRRDSYTSEKREYISYITVPETQLVNLMRYISKIPAATRGNLSYTMLDLDRAQAFSIPFEMFHKNRWTLSIERVLDRLAGVTSKALIRS